jgi:enoyl-[acyl-carrier protein] reductase I
MLLDGKRLLVTGVLTEASIAYAVARLAQEHGAEIVLTGFGRGMTITERVAKRLPAAVDVLELDVTQPEHLDATAAALSERWGRLDGVVHAIGFAPQSAIGGGFLATPWEDVATAVHISTYSYAALGRAFGPLLAKAGGGSIVGLDFDASVAWPSYDWMGVAKAGLESCNRAAEDHGGKVHRGFHVVRGLVEPAGAAGVGRDRRRARRPRRLRAAVGLDARRHRRDRARRRRRPRDRRRPHLNPPVAWTAAEGLCREHPHNVADTTLAV